MNSRRAIPALLTAAALVLLFILARGRRDGAPLEKPSSGKTSLASPSAVPSVPSREPVRRFLVETVRVVQGGERASIVAAARALRDALMADPSLLEEAVRAIRDLATPIEVRRTLAVVLGSLPGEAGKRALVDLLRSGAAAGLERSALLAIGMRAIEDGEIFERDDQPYAVEAAPGLVVFVSGPLKDPEARAEIARWLSDGPEAELRLAAARVLRDSTGFPESRQSLLGRLGVEPDAETTAEAAAALGAWARKIPPADPERSAVLSKIFEIVPGSEEVVRFRLAAPISSAPLAAAEAERLRSLGMARDIGTRLFAMEVLGKRIGLSAAEDQQAVPFLASALSTDTSADVREGAALALGRATSDTSAVQTLAAALHQDADWEVRAMAARSLGRAPGTDAVRQALQAAAASDSRPEVRAAAQQSLSALK